MSKQAAARTSLQARLLRINAFIHHHAKSRSTHAAALDSMSLAELAHLSPAHGHRIYASAFGESMAATVKRLRLHWAAADLVQTAMPIAQVAKRSGWPSTPSFTRTFAQAYGMPPAQYRQTGLHQEFQMSNAAEAPASHPMRIEQSAAFTAVGLPHVGSYMAIGASFDALFASLAMHQLIQPARCVALYFDDPFAIPEAQLRSLAAIVPASPEHAQAMLALGMEQHHMPDCRCAVLRYKGPYSTMHKAYEWLFGHWLPTSGHEAANLPAFEDYLNDPRTTPPTELLTDIWLPLAPQ